MYSPILKQDEPLGQSGPFNWIKGAGGAYMPCRDMARVMKDEEAGEPVIWGATLEDVKASLLADNPPPDPRLTDFLVDNYSTDMRDDPSDPEKYRRRISVRRDTELRLRESMSLEDFLALLRAHPKTPVMVPYDFDDLRRALYKYSEDQVKTPRGFVTSEGIRGVCLGCRWIVRYDPEGSKKPLKQLVNRNQLFKMINGDAGVYGILSKSVRLILDSTNKRFNEALGGVKGSEVSVSGLCFAYDTLNPFIKYASHISKLDEWLETPAEAFLERMCVFGEAHKQWVAKYKDCKKTENGKRLYKSVVGILEALIASGGRFKPLIGKKVLIYEAEEIDA